MPVTEKELRQLEEEAQSAPFAQILYALIAQGHQALDTANKDQSRQKAAVYATDRQHLKALLSGNVAVPVTPPVAPAKATSTDGHAEPKEEMPKKAPPKEKVVAPTATPTPTAPKEQAAAPKAPQKAPTAPVAETPAATTEPQEAPKVVLDPDFDKNLAAPNEPLYAEIARNLDSLHVQRITFEKVVWHPTATPTSPVSHVVTPVPPKEEVPIPTPEPSIDESQALHLGTPEPEAPTQATDEENNGNLIEQFNSLRDSLSKLDPKQFKDAPTEDLAVPAIEVSDGFVSENLAQILVKQGKNDKAIEIYKKLIWKFPQKKTYFADLIEKIKAS